MQRSRRTLFLHAFVAVLAALVAVEARAGVGFSVAGTFNDPFVAAPVLAAAGSPTTVSYGASLSADHLLNFDVVASNAGNNTFSLTLTNLQYRSDAPFSSVFITVEQDFTCAPSGGSFFASHSLNGSIIANLAAAQGAYISKSSQHEATGLANLDNGTVTFGSGPFNFGPTVNLTAVDVTPSPTALGVYRIHADYQIQLLGGATGANNWVQLDLPTSGRDVATGVPEPVAVAAIAALACASGARRRQRS